jgi:hypothetical protein
MIGRMTQSWKLTKRPVLGFEGGDFSSARCGLHFDFPLTLQVG